MNLIAVKKTWLQRKLANWITCKNECMHTYIHIMQKKNEKRKTQKEETFEGRKRL